MCAKTVGLCREPLVLQYLKICLPIISEQDKQRQIPKLQDSANMRTYFGRYMDRPQQRNPTEI